MSQEQPRPGQATLAGALIVGGSVFVVLAAWQRISTLHTLEAQEGFETWLETNAVAGLSADDLAATVRVLCTVGAAAAAASVILGAQVFKRSVSARIALTALSPLLLVGSLAADVFVAPVLLAGIGLLWAQPTRDWYAGRPWVQRYEERRAARLAALRPPGQQTPPEPQPPRSPQAPQPPAAQHGPHAPGAPHQVPPAAPAPGAAHPARRGARPPALVAACTLTWLASALVVAGLAVMAAVIPSQSDELFADMVRQQPELMKESELGERDVLAILYVVLTGLMVWALAAGVLAGLAFVGQGWARIVLAISGGSAAVVALFFTFAAWPLVLLVAVMAGTTWLLVRPEVGRWYARR